MTPFAADETRAATPRCSTPRCRPAYFLVGVRAAGLAAGPMAGFDADGVTASSSPTASTASWVVNIGKPARRPYRPRSPRLDYDEVVTTV